MLIYLSIHFLTVEPKDEDIILEGLPNPVQPYQEVELSCLVPRIKPEAEDILWGYTLGDVERGKVTTRRNADGETFLQFSVKRFM